MKTIISNSIIIEDPVEEIVDWCKDNLVLDNPEFKQMKIMGKENVIKYRHIPEHLSLFSNIWNKIEIPFGCLYALWPYIKKGTYETKFNNAGNISIKNDNAAFELRDYQADSVSEIIKAKGGVLVSPCGSGKTICGINIIKRIGKKTLWLCHTTDLLTQTKTAMLEQFPNIKIGLTTNGKLDIGEDVTISTVQTLVNIDPILYKDKFDTVIVDECAHVSGTPTKLKMFSKVLSSIPARYKFGLTATPSREDGLINSMYAYIGCNMDGEFSPTFKVDKSCVKTITAEHIMIPIDNGYNDFNSYELYDTSGMINYTNLINVLSDNTDRTLKIVDNIVKCYKEGRKQVVLSSRKSHCEEFERLLKEKGIKVYYIASKLSAKKREEIIKQKVEWDVIIATYSLLKEGVDIKELDTLHMTMPTKAKDAVVQCAGRIERYMENKKQPIVYDYVDEDIPYCVRTYKKRKGQLKRRY